MNENDLIFETYRKSLNEQGLAEQENISPEDVDQNELNLGIKVEMEHTTDPAEAKAIALDHLAEDPQYYTKLSRAGL